MSGIFISYRREDTSYIAGRLHDRLAAHFGADQIFRDVDTMKPGVDFVERIDEAVGSCDALVAIIGDDWLTLKNPEGRRRIDSPKDWVRLELAAALKRNILIVPVLVENAKMPAEAELPSPLRRLARHNALELTDFRWDYEVQKLIEVLEDVTKPAAKQARPPLRDTQPSRAWGAAAPQPPPEAPPAQDGPDASPKPTPVSPTVSAPPWAARSGWGESAPSSPGSAPKPSWAGDGPSWSRPTAEPSPPSGVPPWVKVVVPAALVAVAAVVILLLALGGSGSEGVSPPVGSAQPSESTPPDSGSQARDFVGPWSGEAGRIGLTVEKVETGSNRLRVHMLVTNRTRDTIALPASQFIAVDNTGHTYAADPFAGDWPQAIPPGQSRGVVDLKEALRGGVSSLRVGWGTVFGTFEAQDGVFVEGITLS
jgi:hypothetical protein